MPPPPGRALDPVQEQGEFLRPQALALALPRGRGKSPSLQAFGQQDQTTAIPEKNFHSIASFIQEDKQKPRSCFLLEGFLNSHAKRVETLPPVDRLGGQENSRRR
jgi:hypothetical protein